MLTGFSANSLFSQGGTWSTRCVANQGCYNNQNFQPLTDSAFAAAVMTQTRENVTGLVAMSSYFAGHQGFNGWCGNDNCQTHPDYSKLGSDPVSNYGIDIRPFVGIQGTPWASDISLVTGTLYKIANIFRYSPTRRYLTPKRLLRGISCEMSQGLAVLSEATVQGTIQSVKLCLQMNAGRVLFRAMFSLMCLIC